MSDCMETVIEILNCYLNQKQLNIKENVDWQQVLYYLKIHNLQGIGYAVLKQSNIPIHKELESSFYQITMHSIMIDTEMERLSKLFNEYKIKYCPVKGYSVKKCYPDPELRTMGDVDILIERKNRDISDKLLKDAGFKVDDFSSFNHVRNYTNKKLYLEVHTKLIHEKLFNNFDYAAYFENAIDHTVKIKDYLYELTPEYHLLFLLMHMAKHFFGEGCGLRMIYDIPMFVNYYKGKIDWNFLYAELRKIKLIKFAESIFSLCEDWFSLDSPFKKVAVNDALKDYIFTGGVFGFDNRNQGAVKLRREIKANDKGLTRLFHKISGVFKWLCPSCKDMRERDIWFKNKPSFLLCFAWGRRWIRAIFLRKGKLFKKILDIVKGNKDAEIQIMLLKDMGLYEEW